MLPKRIGSHQRRIEGRTYRARVLCLETHGVRSTVAHGLGWIRQQASQVGLDQVTSKVEKLSLGRHYNSPGGDLHNTDYFSEKIEETKRIESAYAEHGKVLLVDACTKLIGGGAFMGTYCLYARPATLQ